MREEMMMNVREMEKFGNMSMVNMSKMTTQFKMKLMCIRGINGDNDVCEVARIFYQAIVEAEEMIISNQ